MMLFCLVVSNTLAEINCCACGGFSLWIFLLSLSCMLQLKCFTNSFVVLLMIVCSLNQMQHHTVLLVRLAAAEATTKLSNSA